jgi:tRNA-specific 2-thiouridylase
MLNPKPRRIAVLMSGGVDSTAAALLLKRQGYDLVGLTLVLSGEGPVEEAARLCEAIGIPHSVLDLGGAFRGAVVEPFCESYRRGETPSPCVECNAALKFGLAWDLAEATLHVDAVASGHYAIAGTDGGGPFLARGADRRRDQSYFLYGIPLKRLFRLLLPLGRLDKAQARKITAEAGLSVSEKPDSMDLCFAGQGDYRMLLEEGDFQAGPIVSLDGRVLGEHRGLAGYTVGQRKGLGVAAAEALYVARIDRPRNTLVVAPREALMESRVTAARVNVLKAEALEESDLLFGKIRSTGEPALCRVARWEGVRLSVIFEEPVFAPAAGQKLVLYDAAGHVVAGGTIQG